MASLTERMKKDGEGIKGFKMPTAKDLEAAFDQADVDKGGTVDEEEYILIYAKVRRGEVKGLGGGVFGALKKMSVTSVTTWLPTPGSCWPLTRFLPGRS